MTNRGPLCCDRHIRRLGLSIVLVGLGPAFAAAQTMGAGPWASISEQIRMTVPAQINAPYPYPPLPLPERRPQPPDIVPEWVGPNDALSIEQEQIASVETPRVETTVTAPAPGVTSERFELIGPSSASSGRGNDPDDRPLTEPPALSLGLDIGPEAIDASTATSGLRDLEVAAEDVALLPRPGESIVHLPNSQGYRILFDAGSEELTNAGGRLLDGLAQRMAADPNLWIQIRAFATDAAGNPSSSRSLSLNRALLIRSFLIDRGVRSTRVDIRALGNTAENEPRDRVDLIFSN